MKLVDEIEAAAKSPSGVEEYAYEAQRLMASKWWPHILAALLAGEEIVEHVRSGGCSGMCDAADRFRAATEGTDAAAIGRAS